MQNTHNSYRALHDALLGVMAAMNRPEQDETLIREAGVRLDRALFPLLVRIERSGPIGIVDLAERCGRDHTTVSRQVAKLESLGLVERRANPSDRRMRAAAVTAQGKAMTDAIDAARDRLLTLGFSFWAPGEAETLTRLLRKFADMLHMQPDSGSG